MLEAEQPQLREVDPRPSADSDLEEGQLPEEWSGDDGAEVGICSNGAEQAPFEDEGQEARSTKTKAMAKLGRKKHSKGAGSKKRSREKAKEKYNDASKRRKAEQSEMPRRHSPGGEREDANPGGQSRKAEDLELKIAPEVELAAASDITGKANASGKTLLEPKASTTGLLSKLVEDEVGLWTKDEIDDEIVAELKAIENVSKKRGPETAERKLKRKIAKRKKRAERERELGIRRPPRMISSKPVKVLCTHYMKGRCSKGDQCPFSHDAVPLTKQEPCKFLMSSSCLKGDDCPYSHDLQAFPCKFFHTRGMCYDGVNCPFSHASVSEEELQKLRQRVEKEKKDRSTGLTQSSPVPRFSTPLPPELDPDPLGWGSPSDPAFSQLSHSGDMQEESVTFRLEDGSSKKVYLDISSMGKGQIEPGSTQDKSLPAGFSGGRKAESTRPSRGSSEVPSLPNATAVMQMNTRGRECETETGAQLTFGQRLGSIEKPLFSSPKASVDSQKSVENIIQQVLDCPTASIFDVTKIFELPP